MPDVNNEAASNCSAIPNTLDQVKRNILTLKAAIESTQYGEAERLLQQQRQLLTGLSGNPALAIECIAEAQSLLEWAMGALTDQRKRHKDLLASVLSLKQLDTGYNPAADRSREFFSYSG